MILETIARSTLSKKCEDKRFSWLLSKTFNDFLLTCKDVHRGGKDVVKCHWCGGLQCVVEHLSDLTGVAYRMDMAIEDDQRTMYDLVFDQEYHQGQDYLQEIQVQKILGSVFDAD